MYFWQFKCNNARHMYLIQTSAISWLSTNIFPSEAIQTFFLVTCHVNFTTCPSQQSYWPCSSYTTLCIPSDFQFPVIKQNSGWTFGAATCITIQWLHQYPDSSLWFPQDKQKCLTLSAINFTTGCPFWSVCWYILHFVSYPLKILLFLWLLM